MFSSGGDFSLVDLRYLFEFVDEGFERVGEH